MFTKNKIRQMILPLIFEQALAVTIGMTDAVMVASCGEAAVSGISIVDILSVLLIGIIGALASGGAVVAAQFIGADDRDGIARASNQLFFMVIGISLIFTAAALLFNRSIISGIYGKLDEDVFRNARIYFYITAVTYPFLGIYNAGSSLFRAVGNTKVSMEVSFISNITNLIGNAFLIYIMGMGVAGAAVSTLCSRVFSAAAICIMLKKRSDVPVDRGLYIDWRILKNILYIGVPNGIENGIFQIGKILVSSIIAGFGTIAITANSVAGNVGNLQLIPSNAIGVIMITIVGQCVGASQPEEAKKQVFYLLKIAHLSITVLGVIVILLSDQICGLYHLTPQTTELTKQLLIYHCVCSMLLHPLSFALPNALRAANDVKYTMIVAIASMWIFRVGLAYYLGKVLGMGVFGVWIAMTVDWLVRSICFVVRIAGNYWEKYMFKDRRQNERSKV